MVKNEDRKKEEPIDEKSIDEKSIWKMYDVELRIRDKLLGGVPKNPEVVKAWIDSRAKDLDRAAKDLAVEDTLENIGLSEEKAWCGFKTSPDPENVPYIEERHIKAVLKEASSVLGMRYKATIAKGVFVKPEKIPLPNEISTMERVIHVSVPTGKRSALKKNDFVIKPKLAFKLMVSAKIPFSDFKKMFEAGGEIGLGADRTMGYGKFDYTITEAKKEAEQ